jgi:ATP phosphoribosyltransferase
MLRVAMPNKGSLSEGALELVRQAGYRCKRSGRELTLVDDAHGVEFIFLRPRDIAVYVGNGTLDIGITGRDLALDSRSPVTELLALGFGRSNFYYAVPDNSGLEPDGFGGLRIATSYAELVRADLGARGVDATVVRLDGAVEISVKLGVADLIADVVESGRTLREAGLSTVGAPILASEAVVIAREGGEAAERPETERLLTRLRGILVARDYAMVEYDVPREGLAAACEITPGIESPTVAPLNKEGWVAVKAMVPRAEINGMMEALAEVGARGIIVTDIRTCRL